MASLVQMDVYLYLHRANQYARKRILEITFWFHLGLSYDLLTDMKKSHILERHFADMISALSLEISSELIKFLLGCQSGWKTSYVETASSSISYCGHLSAIIWILNHLHLSFFLPSYVGERLWWPMQAPTKEEKRRWKAKKLRGERPDQVY